MRPKEDKTRHSNKSHCKLYAVWCCLLYLKGSNKHTNIQQERHIYSTSSKQIKTTWNKTKTTTVTCSQQPSNLTTRSSRFVHFKALSIYRAMHHQLQDWWVVNGKGLGRKWSWPNRRFIPGVPFDSLRKTTISCSQNSRFPFRDPNPAPTEHKSTAPLPQ